MADRLTVFQKLSKTFGSNKTTTIPSGYNKEFGIDREILRTTNREELEVKRLEKQQDSYIKKLWNKANSLVRYITLQNEARRLPSYIDYEKMDEYPLIGAALDIFMEESTMPNTKGDVLNIYSNSERVKKELQTVFYDRININSVSPMWTRNTCMYGDNMVYVDVDSESGVIGCKQLPNIEIERVEGDFLSYLSDEQRQPHYFRWKTTRDVEFKNWQVVHFRLLTNDRRLPYGVSVLEKARRFWRNLLLTEDAMRTIRLLRATDRRIFYIDTGNLPVDDIEPFLNKIADRYKRKRIVDPETGQEDLKMNVMGIDQDYFIPKRGSEDSSKVDTIPGQSNLDIADIEYDLKLLATALRVPKTYLNFEEAAGEGKSLAMQDIRFARTINRIQQAMLQGLNEIAITHLVAVGLEDEIGNFTLTLNNPSIQADILKIELLTNKLSAYSVATEPTSTGIAPMSHAKAKKEILNMTDNEIKNDLIQQRFERALGAELLKTEQIIQRTKFFDDVDKLYGTPNAQYTSNSDGTESGGGGSVGGIGGGSIGGGDMGIGDLGGNESIEDLPDENNDLGNQEEPALESGDEKPLEDLQK